MRTKYMAVIRASSAVGSHEQMNEPNVPQITLDLVCISHPHFFSVIQS